MGAEVPTEHGRLAARGSRVMTGYFNNPESPAQAFRFGWFHHGDLGWVDGKNVVFVDRRKPVIMTGGENLASLEVELAVALHPGVAEWAVVERGPGMTVSRRQLIISAEGRNSENGLVFSAAGLFVAAEMAHFRRASLSG